MDMYREVVRSSQYAARRRMAVQQRSNCIASSQQSSNIEHRQSNTHYSKHQIRGNLFKAQSRNSRSHPNLPSITGQESAINSLKPQFQSQADIKSTNNNQQNIDVNHVRLNSQPVCTEKMRVLNNLGTNDEQSRAIDKIYSDPIYALPVKPFLSSQDVRLNGYPVKTTTGPHGDVYAQPTRNRNTRNNGLSQPNIAHLARNDEVIYGMQNRPGIHRQFSSPQLPSNSRTGGGGGHYSNSAARLQVYVSQEERQDRLKQNQETSINGQNLNGSVPPKPPRTLTNSRQVSLLSENNGEPPPKPPRYLEVYLIYLF